MRMQHHRRVWAHIRAEARFLRRTVRWLTPLLLLASLLPATGTSVSSAPSISFALQRTFGPGLGNTTSVALGDMDSDGDLDIITGNNDQPNMIYLNDGAGHFDWPGSARTFGEVPHHTSSVA